MIETSCRQRNKSPPNGRQGSASRKLKNPPNIRTLSSHPVKKPPGDSRVKATPQGQGLVLEFRLKGWNLPIRCREQLPAVYLVSLQQLTLIGAGPIGPISP